MHILSPTLYTTSTYTHLAFSKTGLISGYLNQHESKKCVLGLPSPNPIMSAESKEIHVLGVLRCVCVCEVP